MISFDRHIQAIQSLDRDNIACTKKTTPSGQVVHKAKTFLRGLPAKYARHPKYLALQKEILAATLGVSTAALDNSSGFESYARAAHLAHYLKKFRHRLGISKKSNEIKILYKNKMTPWSQIDPHLKQVPKMGPLNWPWLYGSEGVQQEDFFIWSKLKPVYHRDPAKWHGRALFDFVSTALPTTAAALTGNHSFGRIRQEDGGIIPVGLYREDKTAAGETNYTSPLRVKPADLMLDVSEFWNCPLIKLTVASSKAQNEAIKRAFEKFKRQQGKAIQITPANCQYQLEQIVCPILGIKLPTEIFIPKLFLPNSLRNGIRVIKKAIPKWAKKPAKYALIILTLPLVFLGNCIQVGLGAHLIDRKLKNSYSHPSSLFAKCKEFLLGPSKNTPGPTVRPNISSLKDLFDYRKLKMRSPYALTEFTLKVQRWRVAETAKLQAQRQALLQQPNPNQDTIDQLDQQLIDIQYDLPMKYKISPIIPLDLDDGDVV